jgi:hypothetical protein
MFPYAKLKELSEITRLTKEENIIFLKRLSGWIDKNGYTKTSLIKGITTILRQIKSQQKEKKKKLELNGITNRLLIKYSDEIISYHNQGLGARRIAGLLYELHKAKISHSTIYRFLKKVLKNG